MEYCSRLLHNGFTVIGLRQLLFLVSQFILEIFRQKVLTFMSQQIWNCVLEMRTGYHRKRIRYKLAVFLKENELRLL
jgi:hypothetical protein